MQAPHAGLSTHMPLLFSFAFCEPIRVLPSIHGHRHCARSTMALPLMPHAHAHTQEVRMLVSVQAQRLLDPVMQHVVHIHTTFSFFSLCGSNIWRPMRSTVCMGYTAPFPSLSFQGEREGFLCFLTTGGEVDTPLAAWHRRVQCTLSPTLCVGSPSSPPPIPADAEPLRVVKNSMYLRHGGGQVVDAAASVWPATVNILCAIPVMRGVSA